MLQIQYSQKLLDLEHTCDAAATPLMSCMQCPAKKAALSPNDTRQQNMSGLHSPSWLTDEVVLAMNLKSSMVMALLPPLVQPQQTSPHPKLPCLLVRRRMAMSSLMGFGRQTIHAYLMCASPMVTQSCTRGRNQKLVVMLKLAETAKKKKYLWACQHQQQYFTPVVYSVKGMPGWETWAVEKCLSCELAANLERPYLEMAARVQQQMCITMV